MKIKLQDCSIISNEWIDTQLKQLEIYIDTDKEIMAIYNAMCYVKKQLIPSEKLASISFNAGERYGWDSQKSIGNIDEMREAIPFKSKEDFLNSEIEIKDEN